VSPSVHFVVILRYRFLFRRAKPEVSVLHEEMSITVSLCFGKFRLFLVGKPWSRFSLRQLASAALHLIYVGHASEQRRLARVGQAQVNYAECASFPMPDPAYWRSLGQCFNRRR
jgi:hypothetical protein